MNAELVHGRIMATVDRIFQFPQSGRALGGSLRIAFVPKAACAVVYKVTTTRIILARIRMGRMKNIK
jgi:plasmid stabilization system protein ParE